MLRMLPSRLTLTATAAAALAVVFGSSVAAVQLYYEPFLTGANPAAGQYTAGLLDTTLDAPGTGGQNPTVGPTPFLTGQWDAVFSGPNGMIQEPSLSYIGAPSAGGSQISNPDSRPRRHLSSPLTAATEGTYYVGFLANYGQGNYSDGIQGNDMGYRAVELWDEAGGFLFGVAYNTFNGGGGPEQQNPSTAKLYLDGFGYQILQGAPNSFVEDGRTHLIVVEFVLSAATASDAVNIYLDPRDPVNKPGAPNALLTGIDVTLGAIGGMTIYGGSGTFPVFDELRISDSFIDALPALPFPGDTNDDDLVNLVDYQAIISHMNQPGNHTLAEGDVTGDGKVTIADYRFWKKRRSDLTPPGAGSASGAIIPEPSSLLLAMVIATASFRCPCRTRCQNTEGSTSSMFLESERRSVVGPLLALFAFALAGCGSGGSGSETTQVNRESVRARSDTYNLFLAKNKFQPPKDEAAFRQFLSSQQSSLEKSGLTIDEMFVSPRNSEPLQWVYGKRPPTAGGISVFAYEMQAVDGQRLLLGDRGAYVTVNEAEFKRAFPDAR